MKTKTPALPVLALDAFVPPASAARPAYYVETLEAHVAQFPFVREPHGHDFYLLLYVTQGEGTHTIDLISYALRPGSVFFMVPGQVHAWTLSGDARGLILFFTPDFYLRQYPARRLAGYPYFNPAHQPVLYLPPGESGLRPLLKRLHAEAAADPPAPNRDAVVGAYLYLLLELAARHYPAEAAAAPASAYGLSQVRAFGLLLNEHYRSEKSVGYYAGRLALTANHLNAVCRRVLGQTASALIHERVVTEARRLLTHSPQSVAQVGQALGFDDASYFARYFKKYVGQSPEAFRQHPRG